MNEIYWITRLDAVKGMLIIVFLFSVLWLITIIVCWLVSYTEENGKYIKNAKYVAILIIVSTLGFVFIPNTKEALVIYGVGGGLDYIKSDSTAQQLPKKVIDACDAYLDELLKDK